MAVPEIVVRVDPHGPIRMLQRAARALEPPVVSAAARDGAERARVGIVSRAPRKTGRLARSFNVTALSATEYRVSSDLIYAPVHEFGAVIRPKRRQFLRFVVGGRVVFARKVVIPARPYVLPTFEQDGPAVLDAVADRIESGFA